MSKELVCYYGNWDTYQRNFQIADIDVSSITTIVYSFMNVNSSGVVTLSDTYADIEKQFNSPGDYVSEPDNKKQMPYYGNFNQLRALKLKNPNLRIEFSVGGWTYSNYFSDAVLPQNQSTFIKTISDLLKKYTFFDGLCIDWEYPSQTGMNYGESGNISRSSDPINFLNFLKKLNVEIGPGRVSSCFTGDPKKMDFDIKAFVPELRRFDIMTYDFSDGAWGDTVTAHNSNLYKTKYTPFSIEETIDFYLSKGIPSTKIMIGAVTYSRGFSNTLGPGKPCQGQSLDKTWENGIVDYKLLPRPGAIEYYDPLAGAAYTYDSNLKVLNSFDNVVSAALKAQYVHTKNLGGIIVWEASSDFPPLDSNAILPQMAKGLKNKDYTFKKNIVIQPGFFKDVPLPISGLGTTLPTPPTKPTPNPVQKPISFAIDGAIVKELKVGETKSIQIPIVGSKWKNTSTQTYYSRFIFELDNADDLLNLKNNSTQTLLIKVSREYK